ncbi:spherulin-1A [Eremomyces bilateralis CBS 781.70]|uniref:Spherulin-1A n=1 Tax=Eremomyces bilateralis CBS 781.70 TaxID=1392243 RepID=A0A6G1FY61_9PEZI|nr:spherulin-1A [Eremomyces bilateralis CBS 781.70]KAF1810777.1 spherulin-1A [Eremomyces bilateralis CBS 781.70]
MLSKAALLAFSALSLVSSVGAIDHVQDPQRMLQLNDATTALERLNILSSDRDWLFDFKAQSTWTEDPGSVVNANAVTFPAAFGNGMTMALLTLGPCAQLPPHFHPRGSNYVMHVAGPAVKTYMTMENGARTVEEKILPYQMTIFPHASVHAMENTGCETAYLVSALNSEDPATHNLANAFFALNSELTDASMGYQRLAVNNSEIPPPGTGSLAGRESCLKRCEGTTRRAKE